MCNDCEYDFDGKYCIFQEGCEEREEENKRYKGLIPEVFLLEEEVLRKYSFEEE